MVIFGKNINIVVLGKIRVDPCHQYSLFTPSFDYLN